MCGKRLICGVRGLYMGYETYMWIKGLIYGVSRLICWVKGLICSVRGLYVG